jgi:hypothetical protein
MTSYGTNAAQFQDNPGRGFVTAGAILQYLLVKYPNAVLTLCAKDANNDWIGATMEPRSASGQTVPVRFPRAGTLLLTSSATESINPGSVVYKQAAGQIGLGSTGSIAVGIALGFTTVTGQYVEVLPY